MYHLFDLLPYNIRELVVNLDCNRHHINFINLDRSLPDLEDEPSIKSFEPFLVMRKFGGYFGHIFTFFCSVSCSAVALRNMSNFIRHPSTRLRLSSEPTHHWRFLEFLDEIWCGANVLRNTHFPHNFYRKWVFRRKFARSPRNVKTWNFILFPRAHHANPCSGTGYMRIGSEVRCRMLQKWKFPTFLSLIDDIYII